MTTIFHVSDLHFGREDRNALDWFANAVHRDRPDALVITGDLTFRARSTEFEAAGEWLDQFKLPISIEPGNHDLPYFNPFKRLFSPYARIRRLEARIEDKIDVPDAEIVPLRTTSRAQLRFNWSKGIVRSESLDSAVSRLASLPASRLGIVACHHPLIDIGELGTDGRTTGGKRALTALARAGAAAVLSGHVHDPFDHDFPAGPRNVRLIGAGTLSERTRQTRPSYNRIEIAEGALDVEVRAMAA